MNRIQKIASPVLIFVNVMLVFLLLFESDVDLPLLLVPFGRLHPLILHLPIGVFFAAAAFQFGSRLFKEIDLGEILRFLFLIAALTAAFTALFGFFLGQEAGYDSQQLKWHKWLGILTSLATWASFIAIERNWIYAKFLTSCSAVILIFTGHLGGEITHGENYVLAPLEKETKKEFDPSGPLFSEAIHPILEAKCLSCHNAKKMKGELNMATLSKLQEGGKNGPIWLAGDALNSHIIENAKLPIEDKKHMPPKGKPQLTALEIAILEKWIQHGAKMDISFSELSDGDTLRKLVLEQYPPNQKEAKVYHFSAVSEKVLASVNTPFCTVVPLSLNSPALQANFYVTQRFDPNTLKNLSKVADQLVELNLAKMPVSDKDIPFVAGFKNLEKLVLNNSDITGANLDELAKCKSLNSLSLSGCKLEKGSLEKLKNISSLKSLYIWNTGLDTAEVKAFEAKNSTILVDKGFVSAAGDMLKINPPIALNKSPILQKGEKAQLKHSLENVAIRYIEDDAKLDSTNGKIYKDEIPFEGFIQLKALATKDGWFASDIRDFSFFRSDYVADTAWLLKPMDPQYPGQGVKTIIDQKQGDKTNFKDFAWLGFKENNAEILLKAKVEDKISGITLSYLISTGSFILPPTEIQIWAGNDEKNLRLISSTKPTQLSKEESIKYGAKTFQMDGNYKYFKVIAKPLNKLPKWHAGAGQKAWLFIDEVYLY